MVTSRLTIIFKNQMSIEEVYQLIKKRIQFLNKKRGNSINDKGNYIKKYLPQVYEDTIQRANLAMDGMLVLPGTFRKPYFVGNPPIWDSNPVNDLQYRSHLNRMEHWMDLLQAYTLTKEKKYAQKVLQELEDFINSCKRPDINEKHAFQNFNKPTPWKAIQVGIRMYRTWPWIIYHLMEDDRIPIEIFEKFCLSVYEHGEVLSTISSLLWPQADHNHYIMEMLGLLTIGCLFQEFKIAESWTKQAICELERCCKNQITSQGGQIEGCPSYHNGCVGWLCLGIYIAEENNYHFSEEFYKRIKKSMEYSIYSFRPSGTGVPWGDSSTNKGGIDSAINGYIAFDNIKWLRAIQNLVTKEDIIHSLKNKIWLIRDVDALLQKLEKSNKKITLPRTRWHKELKQVTMRTDWSKKALSVFFACRTPIQNNHAHIDPMSFDFTAFGKPLIVDPGKFTYREDENRRNFKSAEWHNTLLIDDRPPFEYISSWRFGPQKYGNITKVEDRGSFIYAEAIHYNYEPVIHKRVISLIDGKMLLILDEVKNIDLNSSVKLYYHMDTDQVFWDQSKRICYGLNSKVNVAIYVTDNVVGSILPAKVSDRNDVARNSLRLCLEQRKGKKNRIFATVIIPYEKNKPILKNLKTIKNNEKIQCEFDFNHHMYGFVWGEEGFRSV